MNKSCPNCNQPNPPDAVFCLNCASPLPKARSGSGDVHVDIGNNDMGTGTTIELRSTDDYIITVHNEGRATRYSLYVSIR